MDNFSIIFYVVSAVTLGSALLVVMQKNLVHSALWMVVSFLGVAGLYLLLQADFLASVQLLVYGGAIAILIAFGVMLTKHGNIKESNPFNKQVIGAAVVVMGFLGTLLFMIVNTKFNTAPGAFLVGGQPVNETVGPIAELLLGDFVAPFEVAAVLLLVAMIGAIVIAKEVKNTK